MMKQKIIENIKRLPFYRPLKKFLFQTKKSSYKNSILSSHETNELIAGLLQSRKPFVISRFGSSELAVLKDFINKRPFETKHKSTMIQNAGFFPIADNDLIQFCELYIHISDTMDLTGISYIPFEDYMLNNYAKNSLLTNLRNLEPYFYEKPWSKYLKNKKVLVIHPFVTSIASQYQKRKLLFKNQDILPDFELITLQAAQTLGGGTGEYTSWFQALEDMKTKMSKIDFDIAIIGAGVYGLPLAAHAKQLGKQAIHLGGSTQILFGVYGRRWELNPNFKDIINEHWTRPSEEETPQSAKKVENACYW